MAQTIRRPNAQMFRVDRTFIDGSRRPRIHQQGARFVYDDGSPVTNPDHVAFLPEPFRTQALAGIARG